MSGLNNDVNALETFLEDGPSATVWVLATVGGIGAILVGLTPALTAVTLLPVPVLAGFTLLFTRVVEPRYLGVRGSRATSGRRPPAGPNGRPSAAGREPAQF